MWTSQIRGIEMKVTDYRDMYYAISNGIEIGLSIDSVLEEVVAERENGNISAKDYNELMVFFKECDRKHGAQIVEHNHAVWLRQQRETEDQNRQISWNNPKSTWDSVGINRNRTRTSSYSNAK